MAKDRYLNRSKTRCISGEKNKSIGQRFRDYQFRSPSIPLTTPINQLTAYRNKKEKEKKKKRGAETGLSPSKISSGAPIGDRLPFHGPVSVPGFE